ncbi:unnamed protein product [Symbiodinium necroappetens]|uniref:Uncharacterized protein n=1 Tax=Symbiodinium necroappetens TaxID=1628268 RepID=A0A812ZE66_9DINO|nr:unnamed protein product [Symbiodinium necroappetens]
MKKTTPTFSGMKFMRVPACSNGDEHWCFQSEGKEERSCMQHCRAALGQPVAPQIALLSSELWSPTSMPSAPGCGRSSAAETACHSGSVPLCLREAQTGGWSLSFYCLSS